jgi:hypothetical protein
MRWQEEVTLTTYEMQWTVRYFSSKAKMWADMLEKGDDSIDVGADADFGAGAGAMAYAKRKKSIWELLSLKSDRSFTLLNKAYKSPF